MEILVSGGTGFLGSAIAKKLLAQGHRTRILTRHPNTARTLFPNSLAQIFPGDITRPETLPEPLQGVEVLVQAAQFPNHPVENHRKGLTYYQVDALGTENLVRAAKQAGVRHILYISGAGTNNRRPEPWFRAKWYAEQAIHATGIPATILRPSWVYGPGDQTLNKILRLSKFLPVVPILSGGNNRVQPIFIDDLAELVSLCIGTTLEKNEDRLFEVGGPKELTTRAVIATALRVAHRTRILLPIPKGLVKLFTFGLQFLPNPPLTPKAVDFLTMDVRIDIGPMQTVFPRLKFHPLEEALASYL